MYSYKGSDIIPQIDRATKVFQKSTTPELIVPNPCKWRSLYIVRTKTSKKRESVFNGDKKTIPPVLGRFIVAEL